MAHVHTCERARVLSCEEEEEMEEEEFIIVMCGGGKGIGMGR